MSEWIKIEKQLVAALEDMYEECLLLFNDSMSNDSDGSWDRFKMECRSRYEMGRAEHAASDSTWDNWTDKDFEKNIREELIDYVIYAAARHTLPIRNPK